MTINHELLAAAEAVFVALSGTDKFNRQACIELLRKAIALADGITHHEPPKTFERLRRQIRECSVVTAYRPHRTQRGHYVWWKHHEVTGAMSPDEVMASPYATLMSGSLHNVRLRDDEVLRYLGSGENR